MVPEQPQGAMSSEPGRMRQLVMAADGDGDGDGDGNGNGSTPS